MFRQMMLNMDHPEHSRLRRILQPIFTPRSIERLRASIEANAARHRRRARRARSTWSRRCRPRCRCGCWPTCSACPATTATSSSSGATPCSAPTTPRPRQHADDAMAALAGMMAYGQAMADDRRAAPPRRHRQPHRHRRGRRRAADRHRVPDVLAAAGGRRQRDHPQRRVGFGARPARARPVVVARRASRAPADRGRGAAPLRVAGAAVPPHRHVRHRARRPAGAGGRQGGDLVRGGQPRPGGVRRPARPRPAARPQPPRRVRRRPALLPRRPPGPARDGRDAARPPAPARPT